MGLGFPPLASVHYGAELKSIMPLLERALCDAESISMYKQGLRVPWCSFAINGLCASWRSHSSSMERLSRLDVLNI